MRSCPIKKPPHSYPFISTVLLYQWDLWAKCCWTLHGGEYQEKNTLLFPCFVRIFPYLWGVSAWLSFLGRSLHISASVQWDVPSVLASPGCLWTRPLWADVFRLQPNHLIWIQCLYELQRENARETWYEERRDQSIQKCKKYIYF